MTGITFDVETITPERASEILEQSASPAPFDKVALDQYAQIMKAGAWVLNAQTISFDENDKLIDGVHRLNACIIANTPLVTLVARGASADTLHTIDQHVRRNYKLILEGRNVRNAGGVLRLMAKLIRIENGILGKKAVKIAWWRLDRVFKANPLIPQAVDYSTSYQANALHSTARPALVYMALAAGYEREIRSFLNELGPDATQDLTSPPRMLALQFGMMRDEASAYSVDKALAMSVLAFNDFLEGKKATSHYNWTPDYGDVRLGSDGLPTSTKAMVENSPPNLGLPLVKGYPGIKDALFDVVTLKDELGGETTESIIQAAKESNEAKAVECKMFTITPKMAEKLLSYNRGNRRIQPEHVAQIANDIKEGYWAVNAQPISFTRNPFTLGPDDTTRLLNGQHRLRACVKAGIEIDVPIAWNVPDAAFPTYDTHARRPVRGVGKVEGVDLRVLAAASKYLWRELKGLPLNAPRATPSPSEIKAILEEHPKLAEGYKFSRKVSMQEVAPGASLTYFIYRIKRENTEWAEKFLEELSTGEGIAKGNPLLNFKKKHAKFRETASRFEVLQNLLDIWGKYKEYMAKLEKKKAKSKPSQESLDLNTADAE